jgi:hypothetical protein
LILNVAIFNYLAIPSIQEYLVAGPRMRWAILSVRDAQRSVVVPCDFIGRSVVRLPLSRVALIWLFRMVGGYVVDHSGGPSAWSASQSIARTAASL